MAGVVVVIEDGIIQVALGGKVAEDDGFGDAGRGGDFLGGGAAEALAGEEIERGFDEADGGGRWREGGEWRYGCRTQQIL